MLPTSVRTSSYFSPLQLGLLESMERPLVDPSYEDDVLKNILQYYSLSPEELEAEVHKHAAKLLDEGKVYAAWQVLLTSEVY